MFALLILSFGMWTAGCSGGGDRPETANVSGKLTLAGRPLPGYVVTFQPTSGRPSVGNTPTDAEGRFELWYTFRDKVAKVGKHKVTLAYAPTDDKAAMEVQAGRVSGDVKKIAKKYGSVDVTPLEFEVTENTTEANIDITLD